MKILETELKIQDRTLKQVSREGRIALYELWSAQGLMYGYEVHVIKYKPEERFKEFVFPEREASPVSEDWGTYGFSYQARDPYGALVRYYELLLKYPGNVTCTAKKAGLEPK